MPSGLTSWKNLLSYAFNAFSVPLLVGTLFAPWERDTDIKGNYSFFEKMVFAILSRTLGFVARVVFIIIGLLFTTVVFLTFPIFLLLPIKISREYLEGLGSFGAFLSYGNTYTLNVHSRELAGSPRVKLFGKEKALRMIERGLSNNVNHNVLLLGGAGTGKSTIVGHLGRLGQSGVSFKGIRLHRVVELYLENLSLPDFDKCLKEAAAAGNVILVLKNIHAYESLYERLMPYLQLPNLGIVAITDFFNYNEVLKKHPEFVSQFEKVSIEETAPADTMAVLINYARQNEIRISDEALQEIVRLADRLIGNQPEPAKSVAILEELRTLEKSITIDDVRQIVSDKTNIPIGAIGADEKKVLVELESLMKSKIVGQDEAVEDVSLALRRLRSGVADPNKPAGSFLFLGPTGVGKTYTAKILAECYFGRKDAMIRFDMSEFSLPDSLSLFVDRLASVIEEAPLSLVFFDELEKSNRLIQNLLLQILDEGRLTRGSGWEASFKNAIIIATSNAGSINIIQNRSIEKKELINLLIKDNIFAPEFLNRWSSIILFRPLDQSQARKISSLLLRELAARLLADNNIKLLVTDALIDKVSTAGFDPEFGARPIKRAIEKIVENKVAEYIVAGNTGGTIEIK